MHCIEYNGLNAMLWIQSDECIVVINALWLMECDEYNLLAHCNECNLMNVIGLTQ